MKSRKFCNHLHFWISWKLEFYEESLAPVVTPGHILVTSRTRGIFSKLFWTLNLSRSLNTSYSWTYLKKLRRTSPPPLTALTKLDILAKRFTAFTEREHRTRTTSAAPGTKPTNSNKAPKTRRLPWWNFLGPNDHWLSYSIWVHPYFTVSYIYSYITFFLLFVASFKNFSK